MRHVYSVVRFVPDTARGEYVNIGIIAGSDASGEWVMQVLSRLERARRIDESNVLSRVVERAESLAGQLDSYTQSIAGIIPTHVGPDISERWLRELSEESANLLQCTPPIGVVAESAQEVIELMWPQLIVEPETRPRGITKHRVLAGVKDALERRQIGRDRWRQNARLVTNNAHSKIDFAIHNGHVVYMTQCWSLQVRDLEGMLDDIKAWGWTIRDLRNSGGRIIGGDAELEVNPQVPLAAVYVPPADEDGSAVAEARSVFEDNRVKARVVLLDDVDFVGETAAGTLAGG